MFSFSVSSLIRGATVAILLPLALHAATPLTIAPVTRATPVDFENDIFPILKANCIACHNKTTTKGDLNMETTALMKKGGENGEGFIPGKGSESLVLQAAAHIGDSSMPPKANKVGAVDLKPEELGLLKLWIDQGAKAGERKNKQIAWEALPAGLNPIYSVAVSPEGDYAACSRANQIFVYQLPARELVTRLTDEGLIKSGLYKNPGVAHRDMVESLAFSPDGTRLASGSFAEVKVWKLSPVAPVTGKGEPITPEAKTAAEQNKAPAPMLKLVEKAVDRPSMLRVAKVKRAVAAAALEVAFQNEVAQAGETEIKGLDDRLTKVQTAKSAEEKLLVDKKKNVPTEADAKAAAEKAATEAADALAKAPADKPDPALQQKDKEAKEKLQAAITKFMEAEAAVKSTENAIVDSDSEIKVIGKNKEKAQKNIADAKAASAAAKQKQDAAIKELTDTTKAGTDAIKPALLSAVSPNQKLLATTHEGGVLKLWSATGVAVATYETPSKPIAVVKWTDDTTVVATGKDGTTLTVSTQPHWALERTLGTGDTKSPITDRANAVRFSPDGKLLAVGSGEPSRSGDITLWEVETGKLSGNWQERHRDSVLSLDFSPDGKLLASGGADRAVRVSDLTTGKQIKIFEGHTHHVLGVAWRADGRILVSAGADNVVKIWDYLTGNRKKNVEGWDKEVTSVQFIGNSDQFVATSGDNKVRQLKDSGGEVRQLPGCTDFMQSAAITRTGDVIIAGGQDSKLRVWDAETGKDMGILEEK